MVSPLSHSVPGASLWLPEVDHPFDLRITDECALDTCRLAGVDRLVQHVAATEQLFRSTRVEDDSAVHLRAHRERDARWDVGLDQPRDDVSRGPLRGDDE